LTTCAPWQRSPARPQSRPIGASPCLRNRVASAPDDATATTAEAEAHAEAECLRQSQRDRFERFSAQQQLLARLREWVRDLPGDARLDVAKPPSISLEGPHRDVVARVRREIEAKKRDLFATWSARASRDDARRQARELVYRLAASARPSVSVERGELRVHGFQDGVTPVGPPTTPQVVGLLAWLDRDAVVAALEREIDALPGAIGASAGALSRDARAARIAQLEGEILDLERAEEGIIEDALLSGVDLPRRQDASPAAVLGVRLVRPGEALAAA
jgi:hypothetical protein